MHDNSLDPVLNILNSVIFDFRRRNPSIGETDVILSLRRLRMFLKRKEVMLSSLDNELFNGVVGISSLTGYGKPEIIAAIYRLEKIVGECASSGQSYFDTIGVQALIMQESRDNN